MYRHPRYRIPLGQRVTVQKLPDGKRRHGVTSMVDTSTFSHVYVIDFDDGSFDNVPDNRIELEDPLEALAAMLETP